MKIFADDNNDSVWKSNCYYEFEFLVQAPAVMNLTVSWFMSICVIQVMMTVYSF